MGLSSGNLPTASRSGELPKMDAVTGRHACTSASGCGRFMDRAAHLFPTPALRQLQHSRVACCLFLDAFNCDGGKQAACIPDRDGLLFTLHLLASIGFNAATFLKSIAFTYCEETHCKKGPCLGARLLVFLPVATLVLDYEYTVCCVSGPLTFCRKHACRPCRSTREQPQALQEERVDHVGSRDAPTADAFSRLLLT